jgi:hypothetical protein
MLRLFLAGGTPNLTGTSPGYDCEPFFVYVPPGTTRAVTLYADFRINPETSALTPAAGPMLAVLDASNTVLNQVRLSANVTPIGISGIQMLTSVTLSASGFIRCRLVGGSNTVFTRWCVAARVMAYIGTATDVPFTTEGLANPGWFEALKELQVLSVPAETIDVDRQSATGFFARAWEPLAMIGSVLEIENSTFRASVVSLMEDLVEPDRSQLRLQTESERLSKTLASL